LRFPAAKLHFSAPFLHTMQN